MEMVIFTGTVSSQSSSGETVTVSIYPDSNTISINTVGLTNSVGVYNINTSLASGSYTSRAMISDDSKYLSAISNNVAFTIPTVLNYNYIIYRDTSIIYLKDKNNVIITSNADASTVFNYANSIMTTGGTLFVDSGTYTLSNIVKFKRDNFTCRGNGLSTVINVPYDNFGFHITPTGNLVSNVTLEKMKFVGPSGSLSNLANLIMVSWTKNVSIRDCYLTGCGFHSIFIVESDYALVDRCTVTYGAYDAIAFASSADNCVASNNFVSHIGMAGYNGIDFNGKSKPSTGNTIINNTIEWCHGGICFDTASGNTAIGNVISHVVLGIDNTGSGGATPTTDNKLLNNKISYSAGSGGYSAGIQNSKLADRTVISGNEFSYFTDGRAILLGSTSCLLENNILRDGGKGFQIFNSGNTIRNNQLTNLNIGFELTSSGTLNAMSGNTFTNVTTPYKYV